MIRKTSAQISLSTTRSPVSYIIPWLASRQYSGLHSLLIVLALNSAESLIRLRGPSSSNGTGRVEIYVNGEWGTICQHSWDILAARVACRQLGYLDALRELKGGQVPPGSGKIWLQNVNCVGNEEVITSCPTIKNGKRDCEHSDDAGVQCSLAGTKL